MNDKKRIKPINFIAILLIIVPVICLLVWLVLVNVPVRSTADYPEITYKSLDGKVTLKNCFGTFDDGKRIVNICTNITYGGDAHVVELIGPEEGGAQLDSWDYVFTCKAFMIYRAGDNAVLYEPNDFIILIPAR